MAAVLAALRRVACRSAAVQRRLSGVPDEIAELQRASVAALNRADGNGGAASGALQEPGPEDCCNRGCTNCVWTTYTEGLAQALGRSRADDAAAPASLDAAPAQASAEASKDDESPRPVR